MDVNNITSTDEALIKANLDLESSKVPSAYIPVELSSKGFLGSPKKFHIKNFSTESIVQLGLTDDSELPIRVVHMLDDLIYEENVSVKDFHEQEVIELLIFLYKNFYTTVLADVDYEPDDSDKEFLAKQCGGYETDEYRKRIRSLEQKTWKPTFSIDLDQLKYYEIDENFKKNVTVTKKNGFSVTYSFPKYGDILVLKKYLDVKFSNEDKRFASIMETYKFSESAKQDLLNGKNIDFAHLPKIPKAELDKAKEYEIEKATFLVKATQALHLVKYRGTDVSDMSLDKKMELVKDPDLDFTTFKKVSDYFKELKVGVIQEMKILSPIQSKLIDRRYSFRVYDLLSSINSGESDGITLSFE